MNSGLNAFPNGWIGRDAVNQQTIDESNAILKQEFTVAGTYNNITPPSSARGVTILAYGGGGGGQGGGAQLSGTEVTGGGGGGGGGSFLASYRLTAFPQAFQPFNFQVVVGAGGAGGAGRNTAGNGNGGSNGGISTVFLTNSARTTQVRLAYAYGGVAGFGSGGQRNGAGGMLYPFGLVLSSSPCSSQAGGGTSGWNSGGFRFPSAWSANNFIPLTVYTCGGGGSGGVVNSNGTSQQAGGAGGYGFWHVDSIYRAADGGTGDGADANIEEVIFGGVGGNGGYSAIVANARAGFRGGNGIRGGGGGGGGGVVLDAATGTYASGAGGAGGAGYVMLLWTL